MSDQFYILTNGAGLKSFYRGGVPPSGAVTVEEADWIAQRDDAVANGAAAAIASIPVITYKADIWRRATDKEAEALDALLKAQPVRQQRIFADATVIDHADPLAETLRAAIVKAFDEKTADRLLAPSA